MFQFFTDNSEFTHYGRLNGIPCYFKEPYSDGPQVAGTNILFDWAILHVAPLIQSVVNTLGWLANPVDYEAGWMFEIRGVLDHSPKKVNR